MPLLHGLGLPGRPSVLARTRTRPADGEAVAAPRAAEPAPGDDLGERFRTLLAAADEQDEDRARRALLASAVHRLVPDEARILDYLARRPQGDAVPVVHIGCLTGTGLDATPALENASTVGRRAGVTLPSMTPHYLRRLLDAGLVALGEEDPRLEDDYRVVLADPGVLAAIGHVTRAGATPHVLRHTLTLTPLGVELCAAGENA